MDNSDLFFRKVPKTDKNVTHSNETWIEIAMLNLKNG